MYKTMKKYSKQGKIRQPISNTCSWVSNNVHAHNMIDMFILMPNMRSWFVYNLIFKVIVKYFFFGAQIIFLRRTQKCYVLYYYLLYNFYIFSVKRTLLLLWLTKTFLIKLCWRKNAHWPSHVLKWIQNLLHLF